MDITTTTTSPFKTIDSPSPIQPLKSLSFTNALLPIILHYGECLKNHAATLGGHALDGCGEFMASPSATASDPTSLKCAACGCHRNFHRRHDDSLPKHALIEYQPLHRHRPPPPPIDSPSSPSPPPISSYPASAPHMLLALSDGFQNHDHSAAAPIAQIRGQSTGRKRFRTKFSEKQKEKMLEFAKRIGWKIQRRDEGEISEFCREIGVERGVLKVWMHNNKSNLGKREILNLTNNNGENPYNFNKINNSTGNGGETQQQINQSESSGSPGHVNFTNGNGNGNGNASSSSS